MSFSFLFALTLASALGCALIAGVFFAFSSFVMKALSRLPPAQGIAAMQSIDVVVIGPWFMTVFLGTAAGSAALLIFSVRRWGEPGAVCLLTGSLLYLIGTFLVTVAFNVPRNEALAAVAPTGAGSEAVWMDYVAGWTRWNHVRTAAALAAAVLLILALVFQCRS